MRALQRLVLWQGDFKMVDAFKRALELNESLRDDKGRVLVVDFEKVRQKKDITTIIDLFPNVETGERVFRTKINVKYIDPIAANAYKDIELKDVRQMSDKEIEDFVKKQKFDFALWFKYLKDFQIKRILDFDIAVILQLSGCNFHDEMGRGGCLYCYGDDLSNTGVKSDVNTWINVDQVLNSMLDAREKLNSQYKSFGFDVNVRVLRISGGEPTTLLDFALDVMEEAKRRNLDFVYLLDCNLSTSSAIKKLIDTGVYERHILERIAVHPVKILAAIKGVNRQNLLSNVRANTSMYEQYKTIKLFLNANHDLFFQMYNPEPEALERYFEIMDNKIKNFSKRVHIGPLSPYTTNEERIKAEAKRKKIDPDKAFQEQQKEWKNNFTQSEEIINNYLIKTHGVGYKDTVRSDVELKILK